MVSDIITSKEQIVSAGRVRAARKTSSHKRNKYRTSNVKHQTAASGPVAAGPRAARALIRRWSGKILRSVGGRPRMRIEGGGRTAHRPRPRFRGRYRDPPRGP